MGLRSRLSARGARAWSSSKNQISPDEIFSETEIFAIVEKRKPCAFKTIK